MLGHPTGRLLLSREAYAIDMDAIITAAAENDKIIEMNCTSQRMDLDWRWLRVARDRGVMTSINPDAHNTGMVATIPLGVKLARKAGLTPHDVLNTRDTQSMTTFLEDRKRKRKS
jgi:DNA polymerase (family 10)